METIIYILKSAAILTLFYLIYAILLRKETHFKAHRVFLFTGVLASFVLPLLYFTQTIYIDPPAIHEVTGTSGIITPVMTNPSEPDSSVNWWNAAILIYLTGCGFVLFRFVRELFSLIVLLKSNPGKRFRGFRYVQVSKNIAPFSFFNYIVYNPELHSDKELKMILRHEQAHAFQWHSADIILANLLIVAQWANPFAWLYKKSVEENLEFLADNATIIAVSSKKDYQLALVKASSAYHLPALTTNFYKSFIKKRIIMLNKRNSKKHHVLKVAAVLPLLAVFLWSFNVKETISYNEIPSEDLTEDVQSRTPSGEIKSMKTVIDEPESYDVSKKANTSVTLVNEKPETAAKGNSSLNSGTTPLAKVVKDIRIKITKNTTDAELEKIKADMKRDHGIDINYSTKRNNKNEITSISLQVSGNGTNGNYSVSDDEAIADFEFFIEEDGKMGFYSKEMEVRKAERDLARAERMEDRSEANNKRIRDREKMREEIIVERNAIRKEMEQRREEMKERRKVMLIKSDTDGGGLFDDEDEIVAREYVIAGSGSDEDEDKDEGVFVVRSSKNGKIARMKGHVIENSILIDKDTSDESLTKIKSKLAARGMDFKYNKLKRNASGEITSIRITVVDSDKGSKQTIIAKADDGEPIDEILINLR